MQKARLNASVTQKRIRDLSVNMRMKEALIKELDRTGALTSYIVLLCIVRMAAVADSSASDVPHHIGKYWRNTEN